jgi:hypothetical protein
MTTRAASVSEALPSPSPGQRLCGTSTTDSACPSATRRYDLTRTGVARHRPERTAEASSDALGDTSVLIGVGVALGTIRRMESQMLERRHEGFLKS